MPEDLRSLFLLDSDIAFLNHGSFGACPAPVFETYQQWQRTFESKPVKYHARLAAELLHESRGALGQFLNADADDLVYVTNTTVGANIVAHSLELGPGDEVLGTNHEYGACDRMWGFLARERGFTYRNAEIPVSITTHTDMIERLFAEVRPETKALFISHITSPTALTFPIAEICRRAREAGLITLVDGAHAPGQIPLDMQKIGADFYTGNLHKWLCAPKGAAFLYARREMQPLLKPLIISWGLNPIMPSGSDFIDHHEYRGTREIAAPLSVPAAIKFRNTHNWDAVVASCHAMVRQARAELLPLLDATPLSPDTDEWYCQMSAFMLPDDMDGETLKARLYDEYGVELPVFGWNGGQTMRISIQGYNTWNDVERLIEGITTIRKTL